MTLCTEPEESKKARDDQHINKSVYIPPTADKQDILYVKLCKQFHRPFSFIV